MTTRTFECKVLARLGLQNLISNVKENSETQQLSFYIAPPMLISGVSEISGNRAALQVLPVKFVPIHSPTNFQAVVAPCFWARPGARQGHRC